MQRRVPFDTLIEMINAVDGKGGKILKIVQDQIEDLESELATTKKLLNIIKQRNNEDI
jgi:hypothetical protein